MKVVAFNGSSKVEGNTYHALQIVGAELAKRDIELEIINIGKMNLAGCIGCGACAKARNEKCPAFNDGLDELVQKAKEADGILLGSPVYFSGVAGNMKCFLDRLLYVSGSNGGLLRHKVGASVVSVRRSGGIPTLNELNKYIEYAEMIMPTSNYWSVIHGNRPGEVMQDAEGVQIMQILGQNMAWIMEVIAKTDVEKPESHKKVWTSFIR